ncbi:hypothetical protein ACFY19_20640 [Streptosporangium saharense]|uniref:hypothetical protein n=1 Tax=Streptosporangium saharense TaxID=1706840 RepID=UPI0036AA7789
MTLDNHTMFAEEIGRAVARLTRTLTAQSAMGWAFAGELEKAQLTAARLSTEDLGRLSAAARKLAEMADEIHADRHAQDAPAPTTTQQEDGEMETWENGADAARTTSAAPDRVEARVSILFGDRAEVVTDYHPASDPLRMPTGDLARALGVDVDRLPGQRFLCRVDGEEIRDIAPL